jgi:hypothetical protein
MAFPGAGSGGDSSATLSLTLGSLAQRLGRVVALKGGQGLGEVSTVSFLTSEGSGMSLSVITASASEAEVAGLSVGALHLPPFTSSGDARRMMEASSSSSTCDTITAQETQYIMNNIYFWAASSWSVPHNATLKRVDVERCGLPEADLNLTQPLRIAVSATWPEAASMRPVCVKFDEKAQTWSRADVGVGKVEGPGAPVVTCLSNYSSGTYAVAFEPEPPSLVTQKWQPPSSTTVIFMVIGVNIGVIVCCICGISCKRSRTPDEMPSEKDDKIQSPFSDVSPANEHEASSYMGYFRHPSYGWRRIAIQVTLTGASSGFWVAEGQTENILIMRVGDTILLQEVSGATALEGHEEGEGGTIKGVVIQDGLRAGSFVLEPNADYIGELYEDDDQSPDSERGSLGREPSINLANRDTFFDVTESPSPKFISHGFQVSTWSSESDGSRGEPALEMDGASWEIGSPELGLSLGVPFPVHPAPRHFEGERSPERYRGGSQRSTGKRRCRENWVEPEEASYSEEEEDTMGSGSSCNESPSTSPIRYPEVVPLSVSV